MSVYRFLIFTDACNSPTLESFVSGMALLASIPPHDDDSIFKQDSIWNLDIFQDFFSNSRGETEQAIMKLLEKATTISTNIESGVNLDFLYGDSTNAFWGIDFVNTKISEEEDRHVVDLESYEKFKNDILWNVGFRNLWEKRNELFPNLILCGEVEQQIKKIGTSSQFSQILSKLKIFNEAVGTWKTGNFSFKEINRHYSLNISPESSQTMDKNIDNITFSLPNGGTGIF